MNGRPAAGQAAAGGSWLGGLSAGGSLASDPAGPGGTAPSGLSAGGSLVAGTDAGAIGRRAVILALGGIGAGLAVSACTGGADPVQLASRVYEGDFRLIALAAAVENQAVNVYRAMRAALTDVRAPAFAALADACAGHHADHAATWNAILRAGRKPAVTGVPLAGRKPVMTAARSVATVAEAAALALRLETQAAQAYVSASGALTSATGVAAAASIAPVEAMHAAILRFILGEYPAPASFAGTSDAARLSNLMS